MSRRSPTCSRSNTAPSSKPASCCRSTRPISARRATTSTAISATTNSAPRSPSAISRRSMPRSKACPPTACGCISAGATTKGPHTHDLPVTKIIDIAFKARVQAISIEAANPRHDHEWEDLKAIKIPDDKILIPGVIDSTTNFVEHPRLVAQRIGRYAASGRSRTADRRRRLRLRHRGAHRPDGRRQHRLGKARGAQRRRRDRQQKIVGPRGLAARCSLSPRAGRGLGWGAFPLG